ncbi:helix-turn-helix transcriptional regulator [Nocardia testacea]|uniref:helix-turn-helix transcriptional regulator n=1 Tax=Nocardia testacea TaxID=248551 RepID=UPI00031E9490|nr:LuxR C-terminal-related transcriptional regulator [Nocardia testacea]
MGAAENLWPIASGATSVFPNMSPFHEECERDTRNTLGIKKFDSAFRRGRTMGMDAAVALALGEQGAGPTAQASAKPADREQQVAELIAQGLGNKQIATRLVISHVRPKVM